MKILRSIITGGAGFIGSNLTDHLVRIGHKVTVLDNFISGKKSNLAHHKKKDVKIIKIDISKSKNLDKYFKGADYVFHLAGLVEIIPSIKNPKKYFDNNVIGTLNIVEAAKKTKIKKLIYAASSSCYGTPKNFPTSEKSKIDLKNPYAATKFMGEELIMEYASRFSMPNISLRFFNVEFIFETKNIFRSSIQPLADLYISLLSLGKCLSLTIRPSMWNDEALLINDPIFLGSVTSFKHANVRLFLFLMKFFRSNLSRCSISAI